MPQFKMHSETDALIQVTLQAERIVLFIINIFSINCAILK